MEGKGLKAKFLKHMLPARGSGQLFRESRHGPVYVTVWEKDPIHLQPKPLFPLLDHSPYQTPMPRLFLKEKSLKMRVWASATRPRLTDRIKKQ